MEWSTNSEPLLRVLSPLSEGNLSMRPLLGRKPAS